MKSMCIRLACQAAQCFDYTPPLNILSKNNGSCGHGSLIKQRIVEPNWSVAEYISSPLSSAYWTLFVSVPVTEANLQMKRRRCHEDQAAELLDSRATGEDPLQLLISFKRLTHSDEQSWYMGRAISNMHIPFYLDPAFFLHREA